MKIQMEKVNDEINKLKSMVESMEKQKDQKSAPMSARGLGSRTSMGTRPPTASGTAQTPQINKSNKYSNVTSKLGVASTKKTETDPKNQSIGPKPSPRTTTTPKPTEKPKSTIGGGLKRPTATGAKE